MPTLNFTKRHYTSPHKKRGKQGDIQKIYNSANWQKLRKAHLMEHPLCENCERNGRVTPATCVHHKQIISSEEDKYRMLDIALAGSNCMSLCNECHTKMHTLARQRNMNYIDYIKL